MNWHGPEVATPDELMLQDALQRYDSVAIGSKIARLYDTTDRTERAFASLHDRLNELLRFLNQKARSNGHYNANPSRELIDLIDEIEEFQRILEIAGDGMEVDARYVSVMGGCRDFLQYSEGSPIPEGFTVDLIEFEPVFHSKDQKTRVLNQQDRFDLHLIGSGSFANVYKYLDEHYEEWFALKRAKRGSSDGELARFRQEYEVMKSIRSPYIVQVYGFEDEKNEYTMEYCDFTLRDYINKNNSTLGFATRKRMALQFLFGMSHLHSAGHLHRDVSMGNVLVKPFDANIVVLKLSDFGLLKKEDSDLTRSESELRGTILDPALESFKGYELANEIYCIGVVLSFIFSGRKKIPTCVGPVGEIVDRCIAPRVEDRFGAVSEIVEAIEALPRNLQSAVQ